ncbi:transcriptional regulator, AlpA family [Belnapia rosea]|uniref:Transcriptional regulator, AlpA family n=1 Tax=Belnapia rosea TaxID=938405 RepID=A0A1G7D7G2_9PROT|nr:transcriptional regulator, AlpA family [Belnapia rosea]
MSEANPAPPAAEPAEALLIDVRGVCGLARISTPTIERLTAAGLFPAPRVVPGCRVRRWLKADIEQWVAALPPARGAVQPE